MITIGAPAALHASMDPLGDAIWADRTEGIAAVWFIDHHQGWFPRGVDAGCLGDPHALLDPFTLMAAGAAKTTRVTIGISVTDLIRRPPPVALQSALSVSWLGRRTTVLGVGSGTAHNLRPYGLDRARRVAYFEQAVAEVHELRRTGARSGEDGAAPLGLTADADVALWAAANAPRTIDVAARYADGWLPAGMSPGAYARLYALLRERAVAHGRDPGSIYPAYFTWAALAETRADSLALLDRPLVRATALYRGRARFERIGVPFPLLDEEYVATDIEGPHALELIERIPQKLALESVLCGSLEEVAERLEEYDAAGCRHVILYDIGRYVDSDGVERSRECLAALARGRKGSLW